MARIPALFSGPIEFTNSSGSQISLPLSVVFFDHGIKAEGDVYKDPKNKDAADAWLAYLVSTGLLVPDQTAPSVPAMVITAASPGSTGNFIQITFTGFKPDVDPAKTKFDVTVIETDTYTGLKPSTIQGILGVSAGAGTLPGLVFVPVIDTTLMPTAGDYPMVAGTQVQVPKNGGGIGNAFSLQAKTATDGTDEARTKVTIKDVNVADKTFTLVATWTKSATGIKAGDIQTNFAYEITVAAPSGLPLVAPAPGSVTLSGGADAVTLPTANASANLVTG